MDEWERGSGYKKPSPPTFTEASGWIPESLKLFFGRHFYCCIFEFSARAVVLMGGSSIEAGIEWVHPRVPLKVSARILGLNIEAGIDWVHPCVPLRVSVRILDRIASNPNSPELSDFDYSADPL